MGQLYFAYGSNLNKFQMRKRCPKATPLRSLILDGYRLVFRYFADIEPAKGELVCGGLWSISPACEKALDRYEGVSNAKYPGLYTKEYFMWEGKKVLYYKMATDEIAAPYHDYVKTIYKGYKDFGLNSNFLFEAVQEAITVEDEYIKKEKKRKDKQLPVVYKPYASAW
jgi:hypothetical protein